MELIEPTLIKLKIQNISLPTIIKDLLNFAIATILAIFAFSILHEQTTAKVRSKLVG